MAWRGLIGLETSPAKNFTSSKESPQRARITSATKPRSRIPTRSHGHGKSVFPFIDAKKQMHGFWNSSAWNSLKKSSTENTASFLRRLQNELSMPGINKRNGARHWARRCSDGAVNCDGSGPEFSGEGGCSRRCGEAVDGEDA